MIIFPYDLFRVQHLSSDNDDISSFLPYSIFLSILLSFPPSVCSQPHLFDLGVKSQHSHDSFCIGLTFTKINKHFFVIYGLTLLKIFLHNFLSSRAQLYYHIMSSYPGINSVHSINKSNQMSRLHQ